MSNTFVCQKPAEGDTIECEDWLLHFECVGLTKAQVHKINSDIPYICKQCIDDQLLDKISTMWYWNVRKRGQCSAKKKSHC